MNKQVTISLIVGLAVVFAFTTSLVFSGEQAEASTPFPSREKVISATGTASTSVEPDLLMVTLGVETRQDTASEALSVASEVTSSIVDAIRPLGITDDDLSTSRLSIYPVYDDHRDVLTNRYVQELVGFSATNMLIVTTPQLDIASDIIDSAVSAGATRVDGVHFTLSPDRHLEIRNELLADAVLDAKKKAEIALEPLDHRIIGVKSVNLSGNLVDDSMYFREASFAMDTHFSSPIFQSDQNITATVGVIFLISDE